MKCAIEIRARERDQVTRKRLNQRKRAKRERDLKRDTAFKDAIAQATAKLAQQTTKRMKRMEKKIEDLAAAKKLISELKDEIMGLQNDFVEQEGERAASKLGGGEHERVG